MFMPGWLWSAQTTDCLPHGKVVSPDGDARCYEQLTEILQRIGPGWERRPQCLCSSPADYAHTSYDGGEHYAPQETGWHLVNRWHGKHLREMCFEARLLGRVTHFTGGPESPEGFISQALALRCPSESADVYSWRVSRHDGEALAYTARQPEQPENCRSRSYLTIYVTEQKSYVHCNTACTKIAP